MTEILISEAAKVAARDLSTRVHESDGDHCTTETLVATRIQRAINVEVAARDARLAELAKRPERVKAKARDNRENPMTQISNLAVVTVNEVEHLPHHFTKWIKRMKSAEIIQQAINEATAGKDAEIVELCSQRKSTAVNLRSMAKRCEQYAAMKDEIAELKAGRKRLVQALQPFVGFAKHGRECRDLCEVVLKGDRYSLTEEHFFFAITTFVALGELLTPEEAAEAMARDSADDGKDGDGEANNVR